MSSYFDAASQVTVDGSVLATDRFKNYKLLFNQFYQTAVIRWVSKWYTDEALY